MRTASGATPRRASMWGRRSSRSSCTMRPWRASRRRLAPSSTRRLGGSPCAPTRPAGSSSAVSASSTGKATRGGSSTTCCRSSEHCRYADVRARHLVDLFHKLRTDKERPLAPKTIYNVYACCSAMFRDARLAEADRAIAVHPRRAPARAAGRFGSRVAQRCRVLAHRSRDPDLGPSDPDRSPDGLRARVARRRSIGAALAPLRSGRSPTR